MTKNKIYLFLTLICLIASSASQAQKVNISKNLPYMDVEYNNNIIRIERIQDSNHTLTGGFSKTSRNCPPFCIQPITPVPGVKTVGELEVIDFIAKDLKQGTGILIDARTPNWHQKGTIPGSINIPFTVFSRDKDNIDLINAFNKLGVKKKVAAEGEASFWEKLSFGKQKNNNPNWDFSKAKDVLLWCNGMWCGQSPRAIKALVDHGYPEKKILYFRGGLQTWLILGLTVVKP